jgi:hypothetical protein
MNTALETAISRIASLPEDEQERFANWLVAELDDEDRWQAKFAASLPTIEQMANDALEEHRRGETKPMPGVED